MYLGFLGYDFDDGDNRGCSFYWKCKKCKHRWITNDYDEDVKKCPECKSKKIKPE